MTEELKIKKVDSISDLEKLTPCEKVFAAPILDEENLDFMYFEGKFGDKFSFLDPFHTFLGAPINCFRNSAEELKFNKGGIIVRYKGYKTYTIENPKEYNKARRLMGLEEFPI